MEYVELLVLMHVNVCLTLLISGDLTRAPSPSLKATFMANWMARPVIVPVDRGSILVTALISPALVRCVFRETYICIIAISVILSSLTHE